MIRIADLFCGAGGTSTGILSACADLGQRADLLAVNHWTTAIHTHSLNHPGVRHLCETLDNVRPGDAIPGGRLNLLAASPECTHHSNAAGGRPKNEQSRATAWHICRWAADLTIDNILIENVREFQNWGPLRKDGKPMIRRKGETFKAFINALRSMGFNVDWRVVNAADFGDATSRQRLIIMARRGKPVVWPASSHGTPAQPWRTARQVIDRKLKGKSVSERAKPLSKNTMTRIWDGFFENGGQAFLLKLRGTEGHLGNSQSLDLPLPTISAGGTHFALCEPYIIHITHKGRRRACPISKPIPTITTAHRGELALIEPYLVKYNGTGGSRPIDLPLDTITSHDRFGFVEPIFADGRLDFLFRMLQPSELAAAMSFPANYQFSGTRGDQVKQIGNAVPVQLARAHARALLS